ncbi:MAG: recombinase family protein [Pseudomonadota bacterium]
MERAAVLRLTLSENWRDVSTVIKHCAIYTRKSTEEGLDQAFNSLDAQREACDNYILSQKSEGWRAVKTRYDDGGLSGGNMNRPALQALMQDIDNGKVDIVIVYKVDRLTRSLADFAKLVERFDKHEVSFVSVTQQFNTSNSMGRLTLNVLLSFAQFEREVGAERVRDKIAASRKKGIWTGGKPPLGYDNIDKKLVVIESEAAIVREIFRVYHETQNVRKIIRIGEKEGWRTKRNKNGVGNKPLTAGPIYHILKNPVYAGLIKGKDTLYRAQHNAIIDRDIWDAVQKLLGERSQWSGAVKSKISPLAGLLYWNGKRMTSDHAQKNGVRYRYYTSAKTEPDNKSVRLKAADAETAVTETITSWLAAPERAANDVLLEGATADEASAVRQAITELASVASDRIVDMRRHNLTPFLTRIDLSADRLKLIIDVKSLLKDADTDDALRDQYTIKTPLLLKRRGHEMRLILEDCETPGPPDETVVRTLSRAAQWRNLFFDGDGPSIDEIAAKSGLSKGDVSKQLRLAFLAPDIVESLLNGVGQISLTAERLRRLSHLPTCWQAQRSLLSES